MSKSKTEPPFIVVHPHTKLCKGCNSRLERVTEYHTTILCEAGSYPITTLGKDPCPCISCLVKGVCYAPCKKFISFVIKKWPTSGRSLKMALEKRGIKSAYLWTVIG